MTATRHSGTMIAKARTGIPQLISTRDLDRRDQQHELNQGNQEIGLFCQQAEQRDSQNNQQVHQVSRTDKPESKVEGDNR
jgi:hypothetical protein